jgi:hypothetical protein
MATVLGWVAFERLYRNALFGVQIYLCDVAKGYCFVSSLKEEYRVRIAMEFVLMKKICYGVVAKFKM